MPDSPHPPTLRASANLPAIGGVLAAFGVFSGCDALVKLMSADVRVPQVTFMTTCAAFALVIGRAASNGTLSGLVPKRPRLALLRALLLAGDTLLIHYAFAMLPLAQAYVLAFLTPVLVAVLAYILLGERLSWTGQLGVLLGFAGVAVALRPAGVMLNLGHAAAIGSALLFAASLILLRVIEAEESDDALVAALLFMLGCGAFGVTMATGGFGRVALPTLAYAGLAGTLLYAGHAFLVRAFRSGDASVLAPFQYSQIIWGCLYGVMLFGNPIETYTIAGGVIIILSGWLVLKSSREIN
ncbi:DMT family transporter [Rhizobium sp. AG207R]|uniref:DMT family transporter n=1 Tax=Rhizobium sp. AG207R TaxID=2802287 RepID=UPI0022ABF070|nr:DMT family transporter [Rhizobium sp. AG207R]MCZ3374511.1 DMT family transporter [Rhizobium sp. AG207R]